MGESCKGDGGVKYINTILMHEIFIKKSMQKYFFCSIAYQHTDLVDIANGSEQQ